MEGTISHGCNCILDDDGKNRIVYVEVIVEPIIGNRSEYIRDSEGGLSSLIRRAASVKVKIVGLEEGGKGVKDVMMLCYVSKQSVQSM